MAAPNSAQLAREAKTFATNAQRTPETVALIGRALVVYEAELAAWIADHAYANDRTLDWMDKYDEWRATSMTIEALGVERT